MNKIDKNYFQLITESTILLRNLTPISTGIPNIEKVKVDML